MSGEPPQKRKRSEEEEEEEEEEKEEDVPVGESEERCLATVLEQLERVQRVCGAVLRSHVTSEERALAAKCAADVAATALASAAALNNSNSGRTAALAKAREGLEALRTRVERERGHVGREVFGDLARPLVEGLLVPDDSAAAGHTVRRVPGAVLRALRGRWGSDVLAGALSHAARAGRLDFPWKRLTMGDPAALFAGVRTRVLARSTAPTARVPGVAIGREAAEFVSLGYAHAGGTHLAFVSSLDDYFRADVLTDYYQEPARLSARRRGQTESVLAQWRSGRAAYEAALGVLDDDKEDENGDNNASRGVPRDLNTFELREALYRRGVKECTQFKCTLARSVYDLYGARCVLDFSAGWGDRLIGAIAAASVERYVGVDPNTALRAGHDAMRAALCPLAGKRAADYTVVYAPFQTAVLPDLGAGPAPFDLVFTSPPFFDFELYTDAAHAAGQSVHDYPRYEQWAAHFLLAALRRAWTLLAPGGHMAIYITDVGRAPVVELMALYAAARLPRSTYTGTIISTGAAETPRPTWVWHKRPNGADEGDDARAARAEALLQRLYPHIVTELNKGGDGAVAADGAAK